MTRRYSPEQTAQRLAYTREWKRRNAERVRAYESRPEVKARRAKLRRRRYRADPDKFKRWSQATRERYRQQLRDRQRAYAATHRDQRAQAARLWRRQNPDYYRARRERRKRETARATWATTCAASRLRISEAGE